MLQIITLSSTCASQPNANLPKTLAIVVSRYDLPRDQLHRANAPNCSRVLGLHHYLVAYRRSLLDDKLSSAIPLPFFLMPTFIARVDF